MAVAENGLSTANKQAALKTLLLEGLSALHINDGDTICEALFEYSALLQKWNRSYSLTGITDPKKIITHHFLDSLSVHAYLSGLLRLDVATGAGFPGLVLALVNSECKWVVLDSNIKKIRFLTHVCLNLGIDNVEVVYARADEYQREGGFDAIVSRAFTTALNFYNQSRHLLSPQGRLLVMKAGNCQEETKALEKQGLAYTVHSLSVPALHKDRCLIEIGRQKNDISGQLSHL